MGSSINKKCIPIVSLLFDSQQKGGFLLDHKPDILHEGVFVWIDLFNPIQLGEYLFQLLKYEYEPLKIQTNERNQTKLQFG